MSDKRISDLAPYPGTLGPGVIFEVAVADDASPTPDSPVGNYQADLLKLVEDMALQGPVGPAGSAGADGTTWHVGSGVPDDSLGNDDDFFLDESNGDIYQKTAGAWGSPIGNLKGPPGEAGPQGDPGDANDGWSPILAVVTDGARRVLQVADWTGGTGSPPASGDYVGPTGLVALVGDAVDVRGATGAAGNDGAPGAAGADGQDAGLRFKFSNGTSGDPGSGKFLFDHATFTSATHWHVNETDDASNSVATLLTKFDDGTSSNKSLVMIVKQGGAGYYAFYITAALTDAGSYDTFPMTPISSAGSIANGDTCHVIVVPVGDKGDQGIQGNAGSAGSNGSNGADGADGGFKFQYNTTTSGDPGSGKFLFNNATFASATALNIAETDGNSNALATFLAAMDDSALTNKCMVVAVKQGGGAFFAFYLSSTLTDNGTYDTYTITPITSGGSPSNNDVFHLLFAPDFGSEPLGQVKAINTYSSNSILALVDKGAIVEMDVASANTLTVPPNTDVAFPLKTRIDGVQYGAGQTTITPGSGVTLRSEGGKLKTTAQYSMFSLYKRGTDEWVVGGSLST